MITEDRDTIDFPRKKLKIKKKSVNTEEKEIKKYKTHFR